jgi:hypothetical protein
MTRDEFKAHVVETIEGIIREAERRVGQSLSRNYCFNWIGAKSEPIAQEQVVEFITQQTYIDADNIYPCFDLGVGDILDDGRLLLNGYRAGYPPRAWGKNWTGRDGPFVPIMGQLFIDKHPDVIYKDIVSAARATLTGEFGIIEGARKLGLFRFSSVTANEADILELYRIANAASGLLLADAGRYLEREALQANNAKVQRYEQEVREQVIRACHSIMRKFDRSS